MNIFDVLSQVESPFTDKEIINLTKKFIECNCDMDEFYRSINIDVERTENPYLTELYSKLFSLSNRGTRYVDGNDSWNIVASSEEALSIPNEIEKRVPIYRIYLNAKGQDKARIVEEYINQCESAGQPYKLKYAVEDGRDDEILVLSYGEDLAKNIELIEGITEGMELGEPAMLTGKYKGKIGIGEEYIQAPRYSYTKTRIGMIPIVMKKFYLDHLDDFSKYIDDKDRKMAESYISEFKEESEEIGFEIDELSDDEVQEKRELENNQHAYNNNIKPQISWMNNEYVPLYNSEIMRKYLFAHLDVAIPEIIKNYHLACKIFGISRDGVFSLKTEEMIKQNKEKNSFLESIRVTPEELARNIVNQQPEKDQTKPDEKEGPSLDD